MPKAYRLALAAFLLLSLLTLLPHATASAQAPSGAARHLGWVGLDRRRAGATGHCDKSHAGDNGPWPGSSRG